MEIGACVKPDAVNEPVAGLDFVETTVGGSLAPGQDEAAFALLAAAAQACPVPVRAANCFIPRELPTTGPEVDAEAVDEYVRVALHRGQRIGLRTIVFGSGKSRNVPEGFSGDRAWAQLAEHLRRWGPLAQQAEITVVVEPLARDGCNIINTVRQGAELVRHVGHPNVRLLADTYHMAANGEGAEDLTELAPLVAHVHCAQHEGRRAPAAGGEDLRPYFRALKAGGYDGPVSMECQWQDLSAELGPAAAELRRQIEDA